MYAYITRMGSRIAGSPAVPHHVALEAAKLLNREVRRPWHAREFGITEAPEDAELLPLERAADLYRFLAESAA